METNKYQGSQVSKAPNSAPLPAKLSPPPPGFTQEEWEGFKDNVLRAHREGLIPQSIKTPEMALVIALKGRELGLDPLYALSKIHVINGKPGLESELMLALVKKKYPDAEFRYPTPLDEQHLGCTIETRRGTQEWQAFRFTMEDAVRAGLVQRGRDGLYVSAPGKQVWIAYPQDMTRARAISRMCRAVYPECIMGLKTPEELQNLIPATSTATVRDVDARFSPVVERPALQEMTIAQYSDNALAPPPPPVMKVENVAVPSFGEGKSVEGKGITVTIGEAVVLDTAKGIHAPMRIEQKPTPAAPRAAEGNHPLPVDYLIPFGRLIGKRLHEIELGDARIYLQTLHTQKAKGAAIPEELIKAFEAYVRAGI